MEEGKIEELISYLAKAEFKGDQFEAEVCRNIEEGMPYFTVRHKANYGNEQMFYDLRFRRDHQFDAYRLEGYKATHRKPVKIDRQIINGIDTAKLEERMKVIDWFAHFEKPDKIPDDIKESKIISDLLELDNNHNREGIKIQELLQFKCFPNQYFDERLKELQSLYDTSREFTATENGICNAHLAYHITSERLDDLYERLHRLQLDQYPGMDLYSQLETILSDNPDSFNIEYFRNEPEGYAEYRIPVARDKGAYVADTYTVFLTPYPSIDHGVYNEIDTSELEAMMQEIDWHNDRELFILHEDREPEFLPQVALIQEQMYRLSQDVVGANIADKLQLKYWTDACFFEGMIQQTAWDYLESLPKRVQQFPIEMKAKTAFNLLSGRAAMDLSTHTSSKKDNSWIRLDLSHKDEKGNYPMLHFEGLSTYELEDQLDLLPISNLEFYPIRNALKQGDLISAHLNDKRKVLLEANPLQKTLNIYTTDMRPIPVNLTLESDWKPAIQSAEKGKETSTQKQKPKHDPFSKLNKNKRKNGRRM